MTVDGAQLTVDDVLVLQTGRVPPIAEQLDGTRTGGGGIRVCAHCGKPLPPGTRVDAEVCPRSVDPWGACRKARWRFRRAATRPVSIDIAAARREASRAGRLEQGGPMRFAHADPPYPGKANYYVERQEVDHHELVARLEAGYPDGWALSTSAQALREVLAICPASTRVCVWRRRVRVTTSRRALSAWEPLLVVGGRCLPTDEPQRLLDDLQTDDVILDDVLDYRGRSSAFPGALVGMKPPQFAVWMFAQLGALPGDEFTDVYPGSGAVSRAWEIYTSPGAAAARERVPTSRRARPVPQDLPEGGVPGVDDGCVPGDVAGRRRQRIAS